MAPYKERSVNYGGSWQNNACEGSTRFLPTLPHALWPCDQVLGWRLVDEIKSIPGFPMVLLHSKGQLHQCRSLFSNRESCYWWQPHPLQKKHSFVPYLISDGYRIAFYSRLPRALIQSQVPSPESTRLTSSILTDTDGFSSVLLMANQSAVRSLSPELRSKGWGMKMGWAGVGASQSTSATLSASVTRFKFDYYE